MRARSWRASTTRGAFLARRLEPIENPDADLDRKERRLTAACDGFDVHCAVCIAPDDDVGRERLVRYCTRPPFALECIEVLRDGRIAYLRKVPRIQTEEIRYLLDRGIDQRVAAVLRPRGRRRADSGVALPERIEPLDALPPHIERAWQRFDAAVIELATFRGERAVALADEMHSAANQTEKDAANVDADDRWRAFEKWNGGAAGLSDDGEAPSPAEARWL